jgi:hypothetical protein
MRASNRPINYDPCSGRIVMPILAAIRWTLHISHISQIQAPTSDVMDAAHNAQPGPNIGLD